MVKQAKESPQIEKMRKKLKKRMELESKQITTNALDQMEKLIHHWIARHAKERISLKEKEIRLFDKNRHSAVTKSTFIHNLAKRLEKETKSPSLKGRVKA